MSFSLTHNASYNEAIIANRALVNGNHPDPTLHNSLPQNFTTVPNIDNGNINAMSQNMLSNSNPLHHNNHLNADVFQHNFNTVPDNGHLNNNSYPNNNPQRSFPQPVQPNPNILIQTGNSQPGALAPTVHVNLNTLPRNDQFSNSQPQTVHVNLNSYPPEANQMVQQHADHRESALQSQHNNSVHQNQSQTGLLNSEPLRIGGQTQTVLNNASTNGSRQSNNLIQTGYSHPTNQTNANRRTANSRSSEEERTQRSNPVQTNQFSDSRTQLQQMPWDRLRGTPAYPNIEDDSSDSSGSSDWHQRSPQRDTRRERSAQRYQETEPSGRLTQTASSPQRRDLQRPIMLNHSQINPNVPRQVYQQNLSTQPQVQSQIQTTIPQTQTSQGQNPIPMGRPRGTTIPQTQNGARPNQTVPQLSVPQTQTSQGQNPIPIGLPRGTTIPQTQTGARPNQTVPHPSISLTEAALRQHTAQTGNQFTNRIQQTQVALQNPGPSQPVQQINKAGQKPPTPPPVLRPEEFQKLPRQRMQEPRIAQPVIVQRRHRSPNMQRQTRVLHTSPQRIPGVHPMHATMHGHPMHLQQVHRGRPRR
ncbi:uncharacterized protein [Garra rufa]|uniref:uncharacterized protein n=1 Tax=Garra rufa TaxID=137080 RepID=UPI003CCE652C